MTRLPEHELIIIAFVIPNSGLLNVNISQNKINCKLFHLMYYSVEYFYMTYATINEDFVYNSLEQGYCWLGSMKRRSIKMRL